MRIVQYVPSNEIEDAEIIRCLNDISTMKIILSSSQQNLTVIEDILEQHIKPLEVEYQEYLDKLSNLKKMVIARAKKKAERLERRAAKRREAAKKAARDAGEEYHSDEPFDYDQMNRDMRPSDPDVKALYRKITAKCHPDRTSDTRLHELFVLANEYYSKSDLAGLISVWRMYSESDGGHDVDLSDINKVIENGRLKELQSEMQNLANAIEAVTMKLRVAQMLPEFRFATLILQGESMLKVKKQYVRYVFEEISRATKMDLESQLEEMEDEDELDE